MKLLLVSEVVLLHRLGKANEADDKHQEALGLLKKLSDEYPTDFKYKESYAFLLHNIGVVFESKNQAGKALDSFKEEERIAR